jgi:TonB-linked SusC/RagA family outer membrane protein
LVAGTGGTPARASGVCCSTSWQEHISDTGEGDAQMKRALSWTLGLATMLAVAAVAGGPGVAEAQNAVIRGTVRSDGGDPVAGANVYFLELNIQAATSEAGRYIITVPGDRVRGQSLQLRVRAIGYRPSSRLVTVTSGEQTVDFTLATDVNRLEEIVVTGVMEGTEQARVPFSLSRVDMADLPVPAVDPLRLLAGRVPGANITSASGRPGASPSVILRGPTSINAAGRGQQPLYILDGVILNGDLPDINPSDIENVEVVKGAAASSLYGARAGNGVIQITTRSGRRAAEGATYNVRVEAGRSDIERDFPLAMAHGMLMDPLHERFCINRAGAGVCANSVDWTTEAARINNDPGDAALVPSSFPIDLNSTLSGAPLRNTYLATQWPGRIYDAVEQTVTTQPFSQTTLDATGRYNQTTVYASLGYVNQTGAIRFLEGYDRVSARLNVDQRLGDHMRASMRTYYARAKQDGFDQESGANAAFFRLTRVSAGSNILQRDTLGRLYVRPNLTVSGGQNENPLISLSMQEDNGTTDRFIGGATFQYTPAPWVDIEANGSFDLQNFTQDFFRDKGYRSTSAGSINLGSIRKYADRSQSMNASLNTLFRRRFGRALQTRWSLRYLYEQQDFQSRQGAGSQLGAAGVPQLNNATAGVTITSSETSVRQIGIFAGGNLDFYDGRYIIDGLVRRDGSSLFGSENRWATFGRVSLAWRASLESWWFGGSTVTDFKLRASRGSAGGRPSFSAQYQTFGVTTVGPTLGTAGNPQLRPEITVDNEVGADFELFRRVGVQVTRASSETRDQILLVPLPVDKGFGQQWQNAGTLENQTWEVAVNLPLITRRNVNWSWQFTYDRTRTTITELTAPPFNFGGTSQATTTMFLARAGERYGTIYGRQFVMSCAQLPSAFQGDCGTAGASFQYNDEGFVVWVGQGNSPGDGITRNLWQTQLPASASTPWGVAMNWGMPIILRDTSCVAAPSTFCPAMQSPLGNGLPDWSFSVGSNFNYGRLSVYALLQGVMGREVWNQGYHWSHLDFITADVDQRGRTVETAKPVGYYWRAPFADGFSGTGGFYDILGPNSYTVEDASYAKLRELSVAYAVGPVGGVGNWTVSVVGRNLFTLTDYRGFDPEVGQAGGTASSAAINAVDAFAFPNTRSLTFALSTSF